MTSIAQKRIAQYSLVVPALLVYLLLAYQLDFVQDDAFITYRYAANFLDGHGLVYNIGERIEGYTNFGWLVYLICWGTLGIDLIVVSKITGIILGAASILLYYLIARRITSDASGWVPWAVVYLLALNQSLAYWSLAGLETAAFAFCVAASLYYYLRRDRLLIVALVWAALLRPEGALVAILLIVIDVVQGRRRPAFTVKCSAIAFALLVPFVAFKVLYYGSVLPNSFYAKTGFSLAQLQSGLEYAGTFFLHYGFLGVGLVVPWFSRKRRSAGVVTLLLFSTLYATYIVSIGGDVLKVHRFFIPIVGAFAILSLITVEQLSRWLRPSIRRVVLPGVIVAMLVYTFVVPRDQVSAYRFREVALVNKMRDQAAALMASDTTRFSVALSTIGVFGYELLGHRIIDMLGLTDSVIARHPENPIAGLSTTWKERRYNSKYVLESAPDYILFSTGVKPSAPAEKALCLYPQFLMSYRILSWYTQSEDQATGGLINIFKRMRPITGTIEPVYSVEYVDYFKRGLEAPDDSTALELYMKALMTEPHPPNMVLIYAKAEAHIKLGQVDVGTRILDAMVAQDSMVHEAHRHLYLISALQGNQEKARIHRQWLLRLVPWYVPRMDTIIQMALERSKKP